MWLFIVLLVLLIIAFSYLIYDLLKYSPKCFVVTHYGVVNQNQICQTFIYSNRYGADKKFTELKTELLNSYKEQKDLQTSEEDFAWFELFNDANGDYSIIESKEVKIDA